ncbi:MAG TPA: hypothetical protein IGS53_04185 [Leptolyngbyaceae cyanobacterium M33_DOE_097]|uniref:Uncharacterized protein n=1 Tax=Oscillatoriales cyanobacterium SpSt-418 TaxID=2282169 RepID=A0A7C3PFY7_9CYAN|nr:hypothetical protein [Leptolyngbyaceae cyanobacterium M33_DOE_097]
MTESLFTGLDHSEEAEAIAADLLHYYDFELGGFTVEHLIERWSKAYSSDWILLAVVEALYQGRYKAVSVDQLLLLWQRREQPLTHFNREFELLVSQRLPRKLFDTEASPEAEETFTTRGQQFFSNLQSLTEEVMAMPPTPAPFDWRNKLEKRFTPARSPVQTSSPQPTPPYRPNWLAYAEHKEPIQQFTPQIDPSDFHAKLKAVADSEFNSLPPQALAPTPEKQDPPLPPVSENSHLTDA